MTGRAQPFHCPYCSDDNLWPHEATGVDGGVTGAWECRSCLRVFKVTMIGQLSRPALGGDGS